MTLSDVTIVVPTCNEAHNVGHFLASLPPALSLIVVDDSNDETPQLICAQRPRQTRVLSRRSNVTQARQIGAAAAKTTWLLFTDADVVFAPDYFAKVAAYLERPFDAVYGPKQSRDDYAAYYRWFSRGQQAAHAPGIPAASGSNLLIRRAAFWRVGGFDLSLTCNEDSEIAWRLKRRGCRVAFAPDLVVYARDHRRLRQGVVRKSAHSLLRCALLFSGLMPRRWRSHDWGYWRRTPHGAHRRSQ